MKFTVVQGLSADALRMSVPARYRARLPGVLPDEPYTLLLFRTEREAVVLSRVVGSALAAVTEPVGRLMAVGGGFTTEGLELLRARGAVVLQLAEFYWTDESYQAIRQRRR